MQEEAFGGDSGGSLSGLYCWLYGGVHNILNMLFMVY